MKAMCALLAVMVMFSFLVKSWAEDESDRIFARGVTLGLSIAGIAAAIFWATGIAAP
jgi:hypothetical protein